MVDEVSSLRPINVSDISRRYVDWMNDPEVVKYTEQRFTKTSESDIETYLHKIAGSPTDLLFGIFDAGVHIGNVKLGAINEWHKTATLSYLIGSKEHWGRGIASRVISKMTKIGFKELKLDKISASVYANNKASARVLEKNDFYLEATKNAQYIYDGERVDALLYSRMSR